MFLLVTLLRLMLLWKWRSAAGFRITTHLRPCFSMPRSNNARLGNLARVGDLDFCQGIALIRQPDIRNRVLKYSASLPVVRLRLMRMARLTSLLRAFPEAMMLLKGAPTTTLAKHPIRSAKLRVAVNWLSVHSRPGPSPCHSCRLLKSGTGCVTVLFSGRQYDCQPLRLCTRRRHRRSLPVESLTVQSCRLT